MEKPTIAQFSPLDFLEWKNTEALLLTPKFQRREVWKTPARSYFIDSLLRNIPVPPILIRVRQSDDKKRIVREVVDGQQRLRAVLDFLEDKYALSKTLDNQSRGKRFSELHEDDQNSVRQYNFLCEVFKSLTDVEVLDIFARVNTYSVGLNAQELRNGRYFGLFKQSAYLLAREHLEFWRRHKIISESSIARMGEVELTSELMIALLAGQQDKKKSIDKFYVEYDETFVERGTLEVKFRKVVDAISDSLDDVLADTEFSRAPLFYTLFCVVAHRMFGLPKEKTKVAPKRRWTATEGKQLAEATMLLSDKVRSLKAGEQLNTSDTAFVTACLRQTDNIKPRQARFSRLYSEAFG